MASWTLIPCLVTLRDEFNRLAPGRDKGADGSIGDERHQQESSDHNPDETGRTPFSDADTVDEVHAIDIDSTGPWPPGQDLGSKVELIRLRHLRGDDNRLRNIIWRDRVASRSWGWTWQARPGIGHFDHAHFSAVYTTAQESDTRPWGVYQQQEDDVSQADVIAALKSAEGRQALAVAVLGFDPGKDKTGSVWPGVSDQTYTQGPSSNGTVAPGTALGTLLARQASHGVTLSAILAAVSKDVDEQAIIAGVLAGLSPAAIAAAIPATVAQQVVDLLAARMAA